MVVCSNTMESLSVNSSETCSPLFATEATAGGNAPGTIMSGLAPVGARSSLLDSVTLMIPLTRMACGMSVWPVIVPLL